jgi:hypothetical protein
MWKYSQKQAQTSGQPRPDDAFTPAPMRANYNAAMLGDEEDLADTAVRP